MTTEIQLTPPSDWDTRRLKSLMNIVHEDREVNGRSLALPATQALITYRFGVWMLDPARSRVTRMLGDTIYRAMFAYVRNVLGFEILRTARIGRRVRLVHQHGVVIGPNVEIGDDCLISHGVVLGGRWAETAQSAFRVPPRLGAGVHLGVGAIIIGNVRVGDGAHIGPLTTVTQDIPAKASVLAPAPRVLRLH